MKFIYLIVFTWLLGCSKEAFLNEKPDGALVVPTTLAEFQAILDYDAVMNGQGSGGPFGPVPQLGELAADNYYVLDEQFVTFANRWQNYYTWTDQHNDTENLLDWDRAYETIFYANIVLDGLHSHADDGLLKEELLAMARFHRAHAYYQLLQVFAPQYDPTQTGQQGIPLRISADVNEKIVPAKLDDNYDLITADLRSAIGNLSLHTAVKTRPSKAAAYGLMARVYLSKMDYRQALLYADSCLTLHPTLLDYNTVNATANRPFENRRALDTEVIFHCNMQSPLSNTPLNTLRSYLDRELYAAYDNNDLRKTAFYRSYTGGYRFKGSYAGTDRYFAGIASDEIYLIAAECRARKRDIDAALLLLNGLLEHRYRKNNGSSTFVPISIRDSELLVDRIFEERRKELVYRGLRWGDLRRRIAEGKDITLKRVVEGKEYLLHPDAPQWTFPIPPYVFSFGQ